MKIESDFEEEECGRYYVEGFPSLSEVNNPERSALQHVVKTSSFSLGSKSKFKANIQLVV